MKEAEIIEIFIKSAEVDRRLPNTARPARVKSMSLPFVHDQRDMSGWGAERYQEQRADFFDLKTARISRNDIGLYEASLELIKLVSKEANRRALWAWAASKAGGMSIAKWAKTVEHVSTETVTRRARRSITEIHHKLECKPVSHNQNDIDQVLPEEPEIGHKSDNIRVWRPDESKPTACAFDEDLQDFSWADAQNARRRARRAQRQPDAVERTA
jgi:hypothetical protein